VSVGRTVRALLLASSVSTAIFAGDPFAKCQEVLESEVEGPECCKCFYQVAAENDLWTEGAERLRGLLEVHPKNTHLRFNLARIEMDQNRPAAEDLFRETADEFLAQGYHSGAVNSLLNLAKFLGWQDRADEAPPLLDAAASAAEDSGDPYLQGLVAVQRAALEVMQGGDLQAVEAELREQYERVGQSTRYVLHRRILFALAEVLYELGRDREAQELDRELIELTRVNEDAYNEASARYNLAAHVTARGVYGAGTERSLELYREALTAAEAGGNGFIEVDALIQIGRLLGGAEGRRHLERALAVSDELGSSWFRAMAEAALAVLLSEDSPEESRRLRASATEGLLAANYDRGLIYDWTDRAAATWATLPKDEAVADALVVLDHIEALRSQQHLGQGRADFFSAWTEAFYWLSGRLLESYRDRGDPGDLELGFELSERMRARVLQDALEVSGTLGELPEDDPLAVERGEVLSRIVGINRRLFGALHDAERRRLLEQLDRLERQLALVEDRIAELRGSASPRRDFASSAQVRSALDRQTALLAFQIAPWKNIYGDFAGGSWLTVTIADDTRVYALPGRSELEHKLETFLGLFERREPGEEVAASVVYGDLLNDALAELPESIERLVLIPDGMLYLVPFAALRAGVKEPTLIERFELTQTPSATFWLERARVMSPEPTGGALVLADPLIAGQLDTAVAERGWDREALGALPHARREGRAIVRRLREGSRLLIGNEASETHLKSADLSQFRLVHFAAHAVADTLHPARSAVILSPGSERDDGLLQPREIAALDLTGHIVVLATCESAGGRLLSGEGALSLARPFLEARAGAIVATLWRIDDAAAARLFDRFYKHLSQGRTVAEALRAAQRDRLKAGAPASDWAGVFVLGNGDSVVRSTGDARPTLSYVAAIGPGIVLLVALILWQGESRRVFRRLN
jgi:CHAT domain-containing protein/tetratricopeptide (TPR) repeat protein